MPPTIIRQVATCYCAADGRIHRYEFVRDAWSISDLGPGVWRDGQYVSAHDQTPDERAAAQAWLALELHKPGNAV